MTAEDLLNEIKSRHEKATKGPFAWQKFGKEWCLTGQYGSRPVILCVRKGILQNREADRDLLVDLTPDHPDSERLAYSYLDVDFLLVRIERMQAALQVIAGVNPPETIKNFLEPMIEIARKALA